MSTAASRQPAIDERLAVPETRFEVIGGKAVYVSPADPPHASLHSKLSALLEAHVAPGYDAATDMLTRTSLVDDIAPDASVYPLGPDPETGGRQLEELAFEIASTQSLKKVAGKAASLSARGVRRVFAIDVRLGRAYEWSRRGKRWKAMLPDGAIADPLFVTPLPVRALLTAAKSDDDVARALIAKRNPVLVGFAADAEAKGQAHAILFLLADRGVEVGEAERARILGIRNLEVLRRLQRCALSCETAAALVLEVPASGVD